MEEIAVIVTGKQRKRGIRKTSIKIKESKKTQQIPISVTHINIILRLPNPTRIVSKPNSCNRINVYILTDIIRILIRKSVISVFL